MKRAAASLLLGAAIAALPVGAASRQGLATGDLHHLRTVSDVQLTRDGTRIAYTVENSDRPGPPYPEVWIADVRSGASRRLGDATSGARLPRWSPDGRRLAFIGPGPESPALFVVEADGNAPVMVAPISSTNHPLPSAGEPLSWSPDGKSIAFVSATPGPEGNPAHSDPMVITRYLYKPTASEADARFNDNRRLHIFIADVAGRTVRQLTRGDYYEHSIDWSPKGHEIAFVSNRERDPDRVFNYDIFAVGVPDGTVRQLTRTKSAEYHPRFSQDGGAIAFLGTTRDLTSSETAMEDPHVWVMSADGTGRREARPMDARQGPPQWRTDTELMFTVQRRGAVQLASACINAPCDYVDLRPGREVVGTFSTAGERVAYARTTPARPGELVIERMAAPAGAPPDAAGLSAGNGRTLVSLNEPILRERAMAPVESFTFKSHDGLEVEAFITRPLNLAPGATAPLVTMIHGGPHSQQGPAFNSKAQIYAAAGFGVLMVNYRGSTGYGQKFADAIFGDQNGGEARDVLSGISAAMAKYAWIDRNALVVEGASYGGQLVNWLVTQTSRFKAAVSVSGISNLVSFNYTAYYHDYLAVEYGGYPHEKDIIDRLWQRSPIRYARDVKTPLMFVHGEDDNDVPIAEAEQFYIALKDVGVETVMVRYPREGHGIRETRHVMDVIDRSIRWYRAHLQPALGTPPNPKP
jgi:dipeptidyl aminopeptidase/acylaminoacyl peptidase